MKRMAAAVGICFLTSAAYAAGDGGQPLSFLKQSLGGRPAAYGGAHTAVGDDAYAPFYNASGMVKLTDLQIGSQLAYLSAGRQFHLLSVVQPAGSRKLFYGFSWARMDLGDQIEERTKNTPDPIALLSDTQDAFFLSLAGFLPVEGASWGTTIKYIVHQLGDANANGYGFDLGLTYQVTPALTLAVAAEDVYTRLDWSTERGETAALQTRMAAAMTMFDRRIRLMGELEMNTQQALKGRGGVEWWALPQMLALRGGYDVNKLTAGIGAGFPLHRRWSAALDYAFATDPALPDQFGHRISMTLLFSLKPPKEMTIERREEESPRRVQDRDIPDQLEAN